jgi:hypothetical protein
MTTTVEISRSMRTPEGAYAGLEHCDGPVESGDVVNVVEPGVDHELRLVYLSVAWGTLTRAYKVD